MAESLAISSIIFSFTYSCGSRLAHDWNPCQYLSSNSINSQLFQHSALEPFSDSMLRGIDFQSILSHIIYDFIFQIFLLIDHRLIAFDKLIAFNLCAVYQLFRVLNNLENLTCPRLRFICSSPMAMTLVDCRVCFSDSSRCTLSLLFNRKCNKPNRRRIRIQQ